MVDKEKTPTVPGASVRKKKRRYIPSLLFILLLVGVAVLFVQIKAKSELIQSENEQKLKKERPAMNVIALELVPAPIRDRINLPGVTKPWIELRILTEVGGSISEKAVIEGARVQAGDVIARVDSRDYENMYVSAKAGWDVAVANLNRLEKLRKQNVTPQSQIDDAVARVRSAKAAMDNTRLAMDRCTITAPFSGIVNRMFVEKGQFLSVGDPVAEILDLDRIKVRVGIPESDVDAVRSLNDFQIRIEALGGRIFHAKKHYLSSTADPMARLYNLDLMLENPDRTILSDMFTRVEIVKREVPDGLSIPLYSVITRNEERFVYVVDGEMVHQRKVDLGLLEGWRIQVTEGLSAGEKVIVVGHRSVNDGDPVNIVRTTTDLEDILN